MKGLTLSLMMISNTMLASAFAGPQVMVERPVDDSVIRAVISRVKTTSERDFKANINNYVVHFEAVSKKLPFSNVTCRKPWNRTQQVYETKFDYSGNITSPIKVELEKRDGINVTFRCVIEDGVEQIEKHFSLQKSFIIKGRESKGIFGEDTHEIQALYLEEGAEIVTGGEDFKLKVKELYSENGKIITFAPEDKEKVIDNTEGKSGGQIQLEVTSIAKGNLTVELRGTNGGKQLEKHNSKPATPAQAPKGPCTNADGDSTACRSPRGAQGLRGFRGLKGLPGGNSGKIQMIVNNVKDFNLNVVYDPGVGGQGGEGGEGGDGGLGGPAYVGTTCDRVSSEGGVNDRGRGGFMEAKRVEMRRKSAMGFLAVDNIKSVNSVSACRNRHKTYAAGESGIKGFKGPQGQIGEKGLNEKSEIFLKEQLIELTNTDRI